MDQQSDGHGDRVEGLLRRWGAAEAAEGAAANARPEPVAVRSTLGWRSWIPTMAAAALVLVAGVIFALGALGWLENATSETSGQVEDLVKQLRAAGKELTDVRRQLAEAKATAEGQQETFQERVRRLEQQLAEQKAALEAEADAQLLDLRRTVADHRSALERLASELRVAREKADNRSAALNAAQAEAERLRERLAEQRASIERLATQADAVDSQLRDLQAVNRRYTDLAETLERLYLAASVPHDAGLRTVTEAARRTRLATRGAAIRERVQEGKVARLVDAVEVVLTRLDLLDTRNLGEVQSFATLVRRGRVIERIEEALASGEVDPEVRAWLLEARLLLTRLNHVG